MSAALDPTLIDRLARVFAMAAVDELLLESELKEKSDKENTAEAPQCAA